MYSSKLNFEGYLKDNQTLKKHLSYLTLINGYFLLQFSVGSIQHGFFLCFITTIHCDEALGF
jgi:hypothetical protein